MIKPLTKKQAEIITAVTGTMMFQDGKIFKKLVEEKLDRAVTLEEWATEEFQKTVQNMYINDWLNLCYRESPLILLNE